MLVDTRIVVGKIGTSSICIRGKLGRHRFIEVLIGWDEIQPQVHWANGFESWVIFAIQIRTRTSRLLLSNWRYQELGYSERIIFERLAIVIRTISIGIRTSSDQDRIRESEDHPFGQRTNILVRPSTILRTLPSELGLDGEEARLFVFVHWIFFGGLSFYRNLGFASY